MQNSRLINWLKRNNLTLSDFRNDATVCARYVSYIQKKAKEFKNKYCLQYIAAKDQSQFDEFLLK